MSENEENVEAEKMVKNLPFMNRLTALGYVDAILKTERDLFVNGQREYARGDNVFGNFNRLAEQLGMRPEQVLLVYAVKHLDGIVSWINGHKSQREDVRGRINDLRVYLAILHLMVESYDVEN